MPFLWRIPIRFTVNERHFPPILIQNILDQKPARSAIPPPRKKEKSTRTSPSAFPTVLRRCRSRLDRRTAVRRIKFPIKVQLCRTFIPLPRDTYPRAPSLALRAIHLVSRAAPAVQGRGGIVFGFSGTENVSRGDSVPPGITQPSHTSSCSPLRGRASSSLMPSFADRPPYSTPYIASVIGMETPCCLAR